MDIEGHEHKIAKGFFEIPSIGFFGPFVRSPNGSYVFAWQDSDYRGQGSAPNASMDQGLLSRLSPRAQALLAAPGPAGARDRGSGRVVLLLEGKLVWERDIERPNDGAVADNGYTVINDWRLGVGCKGTFYAFASGGGVSIQQDFSANLRTAGISKDGTLAWCTTLASETEADDTRLTVFSLIPPKLLLKTNVPRQEWEITGIQLDGSNVEVCTSGPKYVYSSAGVLLNASEVEQVEEVRFVSEGNPYQALAIAQRKLKTARPEGLTPEERECVIGLLRRVAGEPISSGYRATAEKELGMIALACNDKPGALAHFHKALSLYPKIGVKRVFDKLQRELQQSDAISSGPTG